MAGNCKISGRIATYGGLNRDNYGFFKGGYEASGYGGGPSFAGRVAGGSSGVVTGGEEEFVNGHSNPSATGDGPRNNVEQLVGGAVHRHL